MLGSIMNRHLLLFVPKNGLRSVATPVRGLATHATSPTTLTRTTPAVLHLKTGQSFTGKAFGSPKSIFGETVFSTSITSCKLSNSLLFYF
jgi:carbamoyl-phosphate synthase small subunit